MLKIIVYLGIVFLCFLVAFVSPWIYINIDINTLFGIVKPEEVAALKVVTIKGDLEVLIDKKVVGNVEESKNNNTFNKIEPGNRLVTIRRAGELADKYWTFNKIIPFEKNTTVVITYNIGPSELFSEGHIIYAIKKENPTTQPSININLNTNGGVLQINEGELLQLNSNKYKSFISLEQQNKIYVTQLGYESQEFLVLPDTQEERDKFKEYDINVDIHLMMQPLQVVEV